MSDDAVEVNFDGIVGPTHNYAGLSPGNLASQKHINQPSNPRQAALQGLAKMKMLADMGIPQAVLPPHEPPDMNALRRAGFSGSDAQVLEKAAKEKPQLLAACSSASAMWTANAATVSPSADSADGRVHFTPANLFTLFHRSIEAQTTAQILRAIFADPSVFVHHPPLPSSSDYADEGAANHMRLSASYGQPAPSSSSLAAMPISNPAPSSPRHKPGRRRSIFPSCIDYRTRTSSNRTPPPSTPALFTTTSWPSAI